jgi:serine/threonine protein kinase
MICIVQQPHPISKVCFPDGAIISAGKDKLRLSLPGLKDFPEAAIACTKRTSCFSALCGKWGVININGINVILNKRSLRKRIFLSFDKLKTLISEGGLQQYIQLVRTRYNIARMSTLIIKLYPDKQSLLEQAIAQATYILSQTSDSCYRTIGTNNTLVWVKGNKQLVKFGSKKITVFSQSPHIPLIKNNGRHILSIVNVVNQTVWVVKRSENAYLRDHEYHIFNHIVQQIKERNLPRIGLPRSACKSTTLLTKPRNPSHALLIKYCSGGSLEKHIWSFFAAPGQEQLTLWIHQLMQGLYTLHVDLKVVHRDIKPENVFINKNKKARFGDLGLTHLLKNNDRCIEYTGTPRYTCDMLERQEKSYWRKISDIDVARQQSDPHIAQQVIKAIDIYAFGVTIMEMFIGTLRGAFISNFIELIRNQMKDTGSNDRISH